VSQAIAVKLCAASGVSAVSSFGGNDNILNASLMVHSAITHELIVSRSGAFVQRHARSVSSQGEVATVVPKKMSCTRWSNRESL